MRIRNVAWLLCVLCVLCVAGGCQQLTTVVVPATSEIEVPGANILGGNPLVPDDVFPAGVLSEALAQSISQSIDTAGANKDAVDSLKLTTLTLTVTNPNEGERQLRGLGFIEKLTIFVSAEGASPVVAAESAAGAFDGTPGPTGYDMPTTEVELVDIFRAGDSLEMSAELEPSEPPNFATRVRFDTEVTLQINVVGALSGG
jgi:hypothetical protein